MLAIRCCGQFTPSGIDNTTLRNVQSNVILLVQDPLALQTTGRYPGEFVDIEVLLSNWTFMGSPQWFGKDAQLSWAAAVVGGTQIGNGTSAVTGISIAQGATGPVAAFGVAIPAMSTAAKIAVSVTLTIGGVRVAANEWTLAVFPKVVATSCAVPVFAAPELLNAAQRVCSNAAAVPPSLTSQTKPFVLLRYGGLLEDDVAALSRVGGFGVAMTPGSGGWPVCGTGSAGSIALTAAGFSQPWWMAGGMTGTLVYNTSLSATLGFVGQQNILDYGWATTVDGGQAYVLDGVAADTASTVHIRAIPTDGVYFSMAGYGTTVSNSALLWEGRIPGDDMQPARGRFLVYKGFDIIWDHFSRISQPCTIPSDAASSSWWPCVWNADWYLRPDVVTNSHLQVRAQPLQRSGARCNAGGRVHVRPDRVVRSVGSRRGTCRARGRAAEDPPQATRQTRRVPAVRSPGLVLRDGLRWAVPEGNRR